MNLDLVGVGLQNGLKDLNLLPPHLLRGLHAGAVREPIGVI